MKKRIISKVLATTMAAAMVLLAGCGGSGSSGASSAASSGGDAAASSASASSASAASSSSGGAAASGDVTIAYSAGDLNLAFDNLLYEAAEAKCNELGIKFVGQDAQADNMMQVDQVNGLIAQGVDGIVVNSVTTDTEQTITNACKEAGVALVYCNMFPWGDAKDENIPDGCYYVGSDEEEAGRLQGELLLELLGGKEAGVAILEGPFGSSGQLGRTNGNHAVLDEADNITILAEETGEWLRENGYTITQNWISAYGDKLNVVLANNDEMALGAVKACKEAGRDDIIIMGVDATTDGLTAVKNGEMAATVLQDADSQAGVSVEQAYKLATEGSADKVKWIDFVLVTPDDVDDYLN